MKQFIKINDTVTLSDGTKAIFLGYQDNPKFGFFREVNNPDTFFRWEMEEVIDNLPQNN